MQFKLKTVPFANLGVDKSISSMHINGFNGHKLCHFLSSNGFNFFLRFYLESKLQIERLMNQGVIVLGFF